VHKQLDQAFTKGKYTHLVIITLNVILRKSDEFTTGWYMDPAKIRMCRI